MLRIPFLVGRAHASYIVRLFSTIPYSATLAAKKYKYITNNSLCTGNFAQTLCTCESPDILMRPEHPGKVRLGLVPEEWFEFLLPKTGQTGLYTLGFGIMTFLLSKEIYVLEHEYYSGLSLAILIILATKKLGPAVAAFTDKNIDRVQAQWAEMHKKDLKQIEDDIKYEEKEQWRAEGALMLMQAKREMIDMQIETAYREKIMQLYNHILTCLEYQISCSNVERRFSHQHFILWVHKEVLNIISKERGEKMMEKTKADVSAMSVRIKDLEKEEELRIKNQ